MTGRVFTTLIAPGTPPVPTPPPTPIAPAQSPLGATLGNVAAGAMSSALDSMMRSVWSACLDVLQAVFALVDHFSTFTFTTRPAGSPAGPAPAGASVVSLASVWPTLLWLSGVIAFGLFLWQLTLSAVRGGRGMWHAATGPVAYGIALAITVGAVASVLELGDGLTTAILSSGLKSTNFVTIWSHLPFSSAQAVDGVKTVVLGLSGVFGLLPVALGYAIEIIWRQAAILVLVATIPISAAGLLAQSTASWYWRTARWMLAAIAMKPLLALTVVIGVATLAGQIGVVGLLAGIGVLAVSLLCPFALFRLFAFVDPHTQAGAGLREAFSGIASRFGSGLGGLVDTAGGLLTGGGNSDSNGVGAIEAANTARFDTVNPATGTGRDGSGAGTSNDGASNGTVSSPPASSTTGDATPAPPVTSTVTGGPPNQGAGGGTYGGGAAGSGDDPPPPEPPPADLGGGGGNPTPRPPGPISGPRGGGSGGGSGGGGGAAGGSTAAEVEEAAVIL